MQCNAHGRIPSVFLVVVYEIWNYIVAPTIADSTPPCLFYVAGGFRLLSIFELGFRENAVKFLNAVCRLFAILVTANLLIVFLNGLNNAATEHVYLLGLRIGFSLFIIPGLWFSLIRDKIIQKQSLSIKFCVVAGVLSLMMEWV